MTVLNSFQIPKELRKGFENHFEVAYNVLLNSRYMLMSQILEEIEQMVQISVCILGLHLTFQFYLT